MRTLFAFILVTLISTANLAGQISAPPVTPKRSAPQTNTYIVTLGRDIRARGKGAAIQDSGARRRRAFNALNAASVELPDAAALARLQNDPRVLSVFANRPITLLAAQGHGGASAGSNNGAKPKP